MYLIKIGSSLLIAQYLIYKIMKKIVACPEVEKSTFIFLSSWRLGKLKKFGKIQGKCVSRSVSMLQLQSVNCVLNCCGCFFKVTGFTSHILCLILRNLFLIVLIQNLVSSISFIGEVIKETFQMSSQNSYLGHVITFLKICLGWSCFVIQI